MRNAQSRNLVRGREEGTRGEGRSAIRSVTEIENRCRPFQTDSSLSARLTSGLNLIAREAIPLRSNKRRINGLFPCRARKLLAAAMVVEPIGRGSIFSAKCSAVQPQQSSFVPPSPLRHLYTSISSKSICALRSLPALCNVLIHCTIVSLVIKDPRYTYFENKKIFCKIANYIACEMI